jgi:hypothetical protein
MLYDVGENMDNIKDCEKCKDRFSCFTNPSFACPFTTAPVVDCPALQSRLVVGHGALNPNTEVRTLALEQKQKIIKEVQRQVKLVAGTKVHAKYLVAGEITEKVGVLEQDEKRGQAFQVRLDENTVVTAFAVRKVRVSKKVPVVA